MCVGGGGGRAMVYISRTSCFPDCIQFNASREIAQNTTNKINAKKREKSRGRLFKVLKMLGLNYKVTRLCLRI